jgi:hypothetical protein
MPDPRMRFCLAHLAAVGSASLPAHRHDASRPAIFAAMRLEAMHRVYTRCVRGGIEQEVPRDATAMLSATATTHLRIALAIPRRHHSIPRPVQGVHNVSTIEP